MEKRSPWKSGTDTVRCECGAETPREIDGDVSRFCQGCGAELPAARAEEEAPTAKLEDPDADRTGPGTGKPASLEKRIHHEGVGPSHDAVRAAAREEYAAYRRGVLGEELVTKASRSDATAALAATADRLARDFKLDHEAAYALIQKSDSGRELLRRAMAESRSRAIVV